MCVSRCYFRVVLGDRRLNHHHPVKIYWKSVWYKPCSDIYMLLCYNELIHSMCVQTWLYRNSC